MHLVDYVDLIPCERRCVLHRFNYFPDIVDTGMGGGIHFDDVNMTTLHDPPAMDSFLRQIDCRLADFICLVVQRTGQNPRGSGLSDAAYAREHIGLSYPTCPECVGQGSDHRLLTN